LVIALLVLAALAARTSVAADRTSFGIGIGPLYSGLGGNLAMISADDLRFLSVGCSELSRSTLDGTDLTCGVGVGWLRSDIVTRKNSKHGLGINLAVDYDSRHSKLEPAVRIPYVFFFKGIDRKGWNLGLAPLVRWDAEGTELGVMFEVGYQF
jgi:hypothetical protein